MFLFVFFSVASVVYTQYDNDKYNTGTGHWGLSTSRHLLISMCFGTMITGLIFTFAPISGGNMNPAVSWALYLTGKLSFLSFVLYVFAQMLGAALACGCLKQIASDRYLRAGGAHNAVADGHTQFEAQVTETICTAFLVFTVMAATDNSRSESHKHLPIIAPICVGGSVFIAHLTAIPVTGCSINPARSWGAAAASGYWDDQIVFWVFPLLGATVAAILYNYFFDKTQVDFAAPENQMKKSHNERGGGGGNGHRDAKLSDKIVHAPEILKNKTKKLFGMKVDEDEWA